MPALTSWAFLAPATPKRPFSLRPHQSISRAPPGHHLPSFPRLCRCHIGGNGGRKNRRRDDDGNDDDYGSSSYLSLCAVSSVLLSKRMKSNSGLTRNIGGKLKIGTSDILVIITVIMFLLQYARGGWLVQVGAKINSLIDAGQWWRIFTPVFLHSSPIHLAVNCYSLRAVGPAVESWYGRSRFLALYLFGGVMGNVLSYFGTPMPSLGASGAIFGLIGAMSVFILRHKKLLGDQWKPSLQNTAFIVMMNFGFGLQPGASIDNFGHLGGMLGGALFGLLAGPRLTPGRRNGQAIFWDSPVLMTVWWRLQAFWESVKKTAGTRKR